MNTQQHTPSQQAQARSHTYHLLSRLYLHGLSADEMPFVQAIPQLAAALPSADVYNADEMAADHYDILETNIFAHQSLFLDTENLIGGLISESVLAFFHQAGFDPPSADMPAPDHIGLHLACLAWLSAAEADAWHDDQTSQANRMRHLQRRLLDEHLLRWLLPLTQAIRQQNHPFYTALADLTLEMAVVHRADLPDDLMAAQSEFTLPPAPDLLADEKTGLKEIAAYLLLPAYSGLFLSRKEIQQLARRQKLPRGFGSRLQMFTNLLRAAASYSQLDALLTDLSTILDGWQTFYSEYQQATQPIAAIAAVWLQRLQTTQHIIAHMRTAAHNEQARLNQDALS